MPEIKPIASLSETARTARDAYLAASLLLVAFAYAIHGAEAAAPGPLLREAIVNWLAFFVAPLAMLEPICRRLPIVRAAGGGKAAGALGLDNHGPRSHL